MYIYIYIDFFIDIYKETNIYVYINIYIDIDIILLFLIAHVWSYIHLLKARSDYMATVAAGWLEVLAAVAGVASRAGNCGHRLTAFLIDVSEPLLTILNNGTWGWYDFTITW